MGEAASSAGFRDLAATGPLRGGAVESLSGHHEVIEAWRPEGSAGPARCGISSTLRLSGYPWPSVLHTTMAWLRHHLDLGFAPILLFLDEPDAGKEELLRQSLGDLQVHMVAKAEMEAAWRESPLWHDLGGQTSYELSACLRSALASLRLSFCVL